MPSQEEFMRRLLALSTGMIGSVAVFAAVGCSKSNDESLQAFLKQTGQSRAALSPLAGKVTIDGQPAHYVKPLKLVLMLYDETKPDLPPFRRPCRECNAEGEFSFGTYTKGDGIPAGKFIITFAVLNVTMRGLKGPDQLKNLYNDPDRNAEKPEFRIVHEAPGKKDYLFDLKLAGQEAIAVPGPKSLTELPLGG
jgi:hypothetical protein